MMGFVRGLPELAGRGLWFAVCFAFGVLSMALSLAAGAHVHTAGEVMAIFVAAGVLCELIEMMVPLRARGWRGWLLAIPVLAACACYQTYAGFVFLDKVMLKAARSDEDVALRRQADVAAFQAARAAVVATKAQRDPDEIAAEIAAVLGRPIAGGTVGTRTGDCAEPGRAPEPCRMVLDLRSEHAAAVARRRNEAVLRTAAEGLGAADKGLAGRTEADGGLVPALVAWIGRRTGLPVSTGGDLFAVLLVAAVKLGSLLMPFVYRFSRDRAPVTAPAPAPAARPRERPAEPVMLRLAPSSGGGVEPEDDPEPAVRRWIETRTALAPASRMQATEAWRDYLAWAEARGLPHLPQKRFGEIMTSIGMARARYGKQSVYFYLGVELRPALGGPGHLVEIGVGGRA